MARPQRDEPPRIKPPQLPPPVLPDYLLDVRNISSTDSTKPPSPKMLQFGTPTTSEVCPSKSELQIALPRAVGDLRDSLQAWKSEVPPLPPMLPPFPCELRGSDAKKLHVVRSS